MTVQLGNIVLDDHLVLYGIDEAPDIVIIEHTAFDGTTEFLTMPPASSRMLSLVATISGGKLLGKFTLEQLSGIKSIARAGMATTLVHPRGTFSVLVIGVVDPLQVFEIVDPSDDDLYVATIQMREV